MFSFVNESVIVGVAIMVIGSVMGLLGHSLKNKGIIKPQNTKFKWKPGFLEDMLWGIAGAFTMVFLADPSTTGRMFVMAIIGGVAGQNLIMNMAYRDVEKYPEIKMSIVDRFIDNEVNDIEIPKAGEKMG